MADAEVSAPLMERRRTSSEPSLKREALEKRGEFGFGVGLGEEGWRVLLVFFEEKRVSLERGGFGLGCWRVGCLFLLQKESVCGKRRVWGGGRVGRGGFGDSVLRRLYLV